MDEAPTAIDEPTLILPDGKTYKVADLSDEVKELLALREKAQIELTDSRRKTALFELAFMSTENLVKQKLTENEPMTTEEPVVEAVVN